MREILFRGKRMDNGQWVEGAFLDDRGSAFYICPFASDITYGDNGNRRRIGCWYKVDHATVGQYTGLTDKNGKKIFEGDVLDCKSGLYERCKVIYNEFCSAFQLMCADGFSDFFLCSINHKEMEIIGNIHDNPELL